MNNGKLVNGNNSLLSSVRSLWSLLVTRYTQLQVVASKQRSQWVDACVHGTL